MTLWAFARGLRAAKGGRKWRLSEEAAELVRLPEPRTQPRAWFRLLGCFTLVKHPVNARFDRRNCYFARFAVAIALQLISIEELVQFGAPAIEHDHRPGWADNSYLSDRSSFVLAVILITVWVHDDVPNFFMLRSHGI